MRWLLTYADMITLLMVFFIVLYAISQVDKARYEVLMRALKQVLSGHKVVTQVGGTIPIPPPVVGKLPTPSQKETQTLQSLAAQIQQAAAQEGLQTDVSVTIATQGVRVSFRNGILFALGSATIRQDAYPLLGRLTAMLSGIPNDVIVEGYTDTTPIDTPKYHSNWDLSAIRATRVIEYFVAQGLNPVRFSAQAYSQYRPIASNATPYGRQLNRRVDLIILRADVTSLERELQQAAKTNAVPQNPKGGG
jgi:chemotaxis protein MotB